MGLNVNRTCMGSSDYATHMYSYDEGAPDPDLKRFSIDHDRKYILPMLREARAINPDIFLFSSPWSPPGWMKANGSMLGGNMRREYMPSYANYFVKFIKGYEAEGVPVQAITVQNEVDTDQDGRMPACAWPQEYEVDFVRHHLGPLFGKEGIASQIWIIDHNYNLWGRALGSLDTPDLRKYVSAIAWHGYVGDAYRMSTVHDAYPDVDMYWTEGGPDYTDPNYATDWTKWSRTFTGNLRHWCRAITVWNLALDEAGRPNIGPFPCGGLVTINSASREVTRSGQFWALAQYSRFIKRGAVRIGSEGASEDLAHVAFLNPDGQYVLVLTNSGRARTVAIELNGSCASLQLESDSVTTLTWKSAAAS
jgi:glucosylceramidase